ncbi:mitochondrial carrier domain-containing protein [Phycomyces nitens]|nr:mitochondrial carrier domain-containing protein [Phycomyces nitens]
MNIQKGVNPHRPYYTPGLHHQHNYTSLPSNDAAPGLTPNIYLDNEDKPLKGITTRITTFAAAKYMLTMLTSPFDVGTTLLQVQYSPHEDVEVIGFRDTIKRTPLIETTGYQNGSSSDEDEDDAFYSMRPGPAAQDKEPNPAWSSYARNKDSQEQQQVTSRSVYDDDSRPVHQMAPMGGGVLEILSVIVKQPGEGWMSLFKGQRVTWVYEMARACLQPTLEGALNDIFGLYDDTIPLMHLDNVTPNMTTMVASHLAVGILLSPLEIIRTRLIVQSSSPVNAKYRHLVHAFATMCREEGGIRKVYASINLLPTILYHTIHPLLTCSTPLIIDRVLHISASDSPILYGAAQLAMSTMALLITLPLEVIRKRLQCQVPCSPKEGPFETAVALRPVPYNGILDALYKIMKEEGTKKKHNTRVRRRASDSEDDEFETGRQVKTTSAWGIRGLYRGFGMQLAANALLFVFHTINGIEGMVIHKRILELTNP